jgi:inner membrane protein
LPLFTHGIAITGGHTFGSENCKESQVMQRSLGLKLATIVILIVLLLLGLLWIGAIVQERQARRDQVVKDIAESSSQAQRLVGPVLVVPYEKTVQEWRDEPGSGRHTITRQVRGEVLILPELFQVDGQMPTERRARGIYEARLYHANLRIRARFDIPQHYGVESELSSYHFELPSIALGITDIRGIESTANVSANEMPVRLLAGTNSSLLGGGLHAPLTGVDPERAVHVDFSMNLGILGTSDFHVMPVGRENQISLSSNWANPSFVGQYLPVRHGIGPKGFNAQWSMSFFSTNLEESLRRCMEASSTTACSEFNSRVLGVSFVDPVDQYLKTDRAIKYALLFISLTFAGFFLFEVLKRLSVHPIQYGLVGGALALFYLLLLSLSEHVGFGMAYVISSTACVALIGFYVSAILRSGWRGLGFGAALTMLYATLYSLVSADDYALLMGSGLLFGLLAAVMVLTRKVDWFALGRRPEETP